MAIKNFGNKGEGFDFASPKIVTSGDKKAVIFAVKANEGDEGAFSMVKGSKAKNPGEKYYVKGGNMVEGIISDIKLRKDEKYGSTSVSLVIKEQGEKPVQVEFGLLNGDTGAANRGTLTMLTQLANADLGENIKVVAFLSPAGSTFKDANGVEFTREFDQVSFSSFQDHLVDMTPNEDGKPTNASGFIRFDRDTVPNQELGYVKGKQIIPIEKKSDAPENAVIVYDTDSIMNCAAKIIADLKSRISDTHKVQPVSAMDSLHDDDTSFGGDDDTEAVRERSMSRPS